MKSANFTIVFALLFCVCMNSDAADIDEQMKASAKQKVESVVIGQRPSIAELIESLSKEGSASLVVGPEGVGKLAMVKAVSDAYGLTGYSFDLFREGYAVPKNFFFYIGNTVLKNQAQVIVLNGIENLDRSAQRSLAILLEKRSVEVPYPATETTSAENVIVDLTKTRFVLITNTGEHLFRNPVGFRYNDMLEPESDAHLERLADDNIINILQAEGYQIELLTKVKQFVPVRRLSKIEFRTELLTTVDQYLKTLKDAINKDVTLLRKHELVDLLMEKNYKKARSNFHDLNKWVKEALEFNSRECKKFCVNRQV